MKKVGTVALVGRPNVGKSTLMNALLGESLSIVSPKAQTTRHRITGVLTRGDCQFLLLDTPGQADLQGKALNKLLDRTAMSAMADVDVVLWLVDATRWTDIDDVVQKRLLRDRPRKLGLILNKVDRIADKTRLLPLMGRLGQQVQPDFVVPLSAQKGTNVDVLFLEMERHLPEGAWVYDEDTLTPHSGEFLVSEQIRQQLFLRLNQELPYSSTVTIDRMQEHDDHYEVHATIWVSRASQKGIVIGKQGQGLKSLGEAARLRLERLFHKPMRLDLWVKVREGWADNESGIQSFGYGVTE